MLSVTCPLTFTGVAAVNFPTCYSPTFGRGSTTLALLILKTALWLTVIVFATAHWMPVICTWRISGFVRINQEGRQVPVDEPHPFRKRGYEETAFN